MLSIKKKMMVLAFVVSSGFVVGKAFAEPKLTTTGQIGVALPVVGDLKDVGDTGLFFGAQSMHALNASQSVGMGIGYYSFGEESELSVDTEVSIITMHALVHRNLGSSTSGTPFFQTGIGFARTQVNIQTGSGGAPITQGTNQEDISPTLLLGAGFDMPLSDGATFGVSMNYQHFFFKVGDVDGGGALSILAHLRV